MSRGYAECRGIPLREEPDGPIVAWVKYGPCISMAESRTQDWASRYRDSEVNSDGLVRVPRVYDAFVIRREGRFPIGYIVIEYIDALDCEEMMPR